MDTLFPLPESAKPREEEARGSAKPRVQEASLRSWGFLFSEATNTPGGSPKGVLATSLAARTRSAVLHGTPVRGARVLFPPPTPFSEIVLGICETGWRLDTHGIRNRVQGVGPTDQGNRVSESYET